MTRHLTRDDAPFYGVRRNTAVPPFRSNVPVSVSPRALALSTSIRPYLSAAAGPYIHSVSDEFGASSSASVEAAPGGRLAAGANWFVARHFVMGVEGNYHMVGKFDQPDALTQKASGFGMSVSFGFAWGGR